MAREEDEDESGGRPGKPVEPRRLLWTLARGRWVLLTALTSGLLCGVVAAKFLVRHTYEASAAVRYEGVPALDGSPQTDTRRELPSKVQSLRSEAVIETVATRLGIHASHDAVHHMFTNVQDTESGIVTVTAHGDAPEQAANLANTLLTVFIDAEVERRRADVRDVLRQLDERMLIARGELERAQNAYNDFRRLHDIAADVPTELELHRAQYLDARKRREDKETQIGALQSRLRLQQDRASRAPRLSPEAASATAALREARRQLQQINGRLSEDHPRVQALQQQIAGLQEQIRSGTTEPGANGENPAPVPSTNPVAEATANLEAAQHELEVLRQQEAEAQARVVGFSAVEGEGAILQGNVQSKQAVVGQILERRATLESMSQRPDAGFRWVSQATPPESAIPSKKKYYTAFGTPIVFLALAFAFLLAREFRRFRLYTADEVGFWANGPVIGATSWPRDPRAAADLPADLDDFVPEATGTLLIVPLGDQERAIASELARQLAIDTTKQISTPQWGARLPSDPPRARLPSSRPARERGATMPSGGVGAQSLSAQTHSAHNAHNAPSNPPQDFNPFTASPTLLLAHATATDEDMRPSFAHAPGNNLLAPPTLVHPNGYGMLQPTPVEGERARLSTTAWEGPNEGPPLRRAARLADRVLIVVSAGDVGPADVRSVRDRLGRRDAGVGYVVVNVPDEFRELPDRAGDVMAFWQAVARPSNESSRPPPGRYESYRPPNR